MHIIINKTKYITFFIAIFVLIVGIFNQVAFARHTAKHNNKMVKYIVVERGIVDMRLPILEVTDGDTIKTAFSLPGPLDSVSVRIRDIDTPESRIAKCAKKGIPCPKNTKAAKCMAEYNLGKEASMFLRNYIGDMSIMVVRNYKWDMYGGRIDADVFIDKVNIGALLIEKGYAKEYHGSGPKPNWCK